MYRGNEDKSKINVNSGLLLALGLNKTQLFQNQKGSSLKLSTSSRNSSLEEYSFYKSKVYLKTHSYTLLQAKKKISRIPKIAKIYNKEKIKSSKLLSQLIKTEIEVYQSLKSSNYVLQLEDVFETKRSIYLIFEYCEILSIPKSRLKLSFNKKVIKNALLSSLMGLIEVNSLGYSVGYLDASMVVRVVKGGIPQFKLFGFKGFANYGEKMDIVESCMMASNPKRFRSLNHPDHSWYVTTDVRTDSWVFGELCAAILGVYYGYDQNGAFEWEMSGGKFKEKNYEKLKSFKNLKILEPDEADLLKGLLNAQKESRVGLDLVVVHDFFRGLILDKQMQFVRNQDSHLTKFSECVPTAVETLGILIVQIIKLDRKRKEKDQRRKMVKGFTDKIMELREPSINSSVETIKKSSEERKTKLFASLDQSHFHFSKLGSLHMIDQATPTSGKRKPRILRKHRTEEFDLAKQSRVISRGNTPRSRLGLGKTNLGSAFAIRSHTPKNRNNKGQKRHVLSRGKIGDKFKREKGLFWKEKTSNAKDTKRKIGKIPDSKKPGLKKKGLGFFYRMFGKVCCTGR